MLLVKFYFYA